MKEGQHVKVIFEGRTFAARIMLASPNGRSLVLAVNIEALVAGHVGPDVGVLPVFQEDDGVYRMLISGDPIEIVAEPMQ